MPIDEDSGWVEPDIVINGRPLTFVECMAVRVAIGSFRLTLTAPKFRAGLGESLAVGYDRHLAHVERTMLNPVAMRRHGYGCAHDGDPLTDPRPADCRCDAHGQVPSGRVERQAGEV